jgi:hypothetical protein
VTGGAATAAAAMQGGEVVNHDMQIKADVLIKDGMIAEVAPDIKVGASSAKTVCLSQSSSFPSWYACTLKSPATMHCNQH